MTLISEKGVWNWPKPQDIGSGLELLTACTFQFCIFHFLLVYLPFRYALLYISSRLISYSMYIPPCACFTRCISHFPLHICIPLCVSPSVCIPLFILCISHFLFCVYIPLFILCVSHFSFCVYPTFYSVYIFIYSICISHFLYILFRLYHSMYIPLSTPCVYIS